MQWYIMVLQRYAEFDGRSRRKEYWMFVLFHFLVSVALNIAGFAIDMVAAIGATMILPTLYYLATLLPAIGVTIRRLHDTNRSGWWLLIALVPFIGGIILLILCALEGDHGENQYGPNPKAEATGTASQAI